MVQQAVNQAFAAQWMACDDPRLPILVLSGYVNAQAASVLETLCDDAINAQQLFWVTDLARVPVINAAGLAALDAVRTTLLTHGGDLALIGVQPIVHRALMVYGGQLGQSCFQRLEDVQHTWRDYLPR